MHIEMVLMIRDDSDSFTLIVTASVASNMDVLKRMPLSALSDIHCDIYYCTDDQRYHVYIIDQHRWINSM